MRSSYVVSVNFAKKFFTRRMYASAYPACEQYPWCLSLNDAMYFNAEEGIAAELAEVWRARGVDARVSAVGRGDGDDD